MDLTSVAQALAGVGVFAVICWVYEHSADKVPGGWIKASDIKPGMRIVGISGRVIGTYHVHPYNKEHHYLIVNTDAKGWIATGRASRRPDEMVYRMTERVPKK